MKWTINSNSLNTLLASGITDSTTIMTMLQINIAKLAFVKAIDNLFYLTALISISAFFLTFFLPRKKNIKSHSKEATLSDNTETNKHEAVILE
jgi:hypothetical protein